MDNACVIGLGKSGAAAARLCAELGWRVTVSDAGNSASLQQQKQALEAEGIEVRLGDAFDPNFPWNLIVVSPGVRWDLPALVQAREQKIDTIGEMGLAWRALKDKRWVGITGTNGKTTTTALTDAIFQTAQRQAFACGNIGYAACDLARYAFKHPLDWAIAEISSYQIESSSEVAPEIGVWTTFTPDHLERHYTVENYCRIKAHLLRQSHRQIYNGDDPFLRQQATENPDVIAMREDACWTSIRGRQYIPGNPALGVYIESGWVTYQGEAIVRADALPMQGAHNLQNMLMAVAAAKLAGIENEAIAPAVANFRGVPHRLEVVGTYRGIPLINDSKATNYEAAQVGLNAVEAPVILIAGGEAKTGDDTGWYETIREKAAMVLLIGEAAPTFARRMQAFNLDGYEIVETMEAAVERAIALAPKYRARTVLLSPACASFDRYTNFEQRGDHFRQLCARIEHL
ncbi:UDP-N-acetylmuramoyl-L-alanine--D-glutamate ligase [Geitlerinema sp. PCC 9228]|uniref:UDP-N-acetylmuramoyl-L-alanine--D-glutamate ligase n=1 Tax=Geitlerinema sp. PCC 9228 TaxID=111611 RepID=UPI0008F9DC00|nr:UDP-N-acetylmuramoyl-L-alanine--D-glutamate ligase [Geitlerinema sp. PCC 9228]